jgi:WD40 repeat protein
VKLFRCISLVVLLGISLGFDVLRAEEPAGREIAVPQRSEPVDFASEILPILRNNCLACHSAAKAESDLVLENPAAMLKGGASGAAIVAGKADESLLLAVASHRSEPVMPPAGNTASAKDLTPAELGLIKLWIDQGAQGAVKAAEHRIAWQPLPAGVNPIYATAVSSDGQYAACGRANQIFIYHLHSGRLVDRLTDPKLLTAGQAQGPGVAHLDVVQSLAFSPDGLTLASGAYREVKLWSRPEARQQFEWVTAGPAAALASSPDGNWIAVADGNDVRLWRADNGTPGLTLRGHRAPIQSLEFSPDGGRLASGGNDSTISVWNVADGARLTGWDTVASVNDLLWLPAGDQIVSAESDGSVRVWNANVAPAKDLYQGAALLRAAAISPSRQILAVGREAGEILLIDLATGHVQRNLAGHDSSVVALAWNADGSRLASVDEQGQLRVWDAASGGTIDSWSAGKTPITAVTWHADGLTTGDASGRVTRWVANGPLALAADAFTPARTNLWCTPDGARVAHESARDGKPVVVVRDGANGSVSTVLGDLPAALSTGTLSGDGKFFAGGLSDGRVLFWQLPEGRLLNSPESHAAAVTRLAFAADGTQLISGADDGSLRLWRITPEGNFASTTLAKHDEPVRAIAAGSPLAGWITAAGRSVWWWMVERPEPVLRLDGDDTVTSVAMNPSGDLCAVGDRSGRISLYGRDGRRWQTQQVASEPIEAILFSSDGRQLTCQSSNNQITNLAADTLSVLAQARHADASAMAISTPAVWSISSAGLARQPQRWQAELIGLNQGVVRLLSLANGSQLCGVARNGDVRLWNGDGSLAGQWATGGSLADAALSADGNLLATAGTDRRVTTWKVPSGEAGPAWDQLPDALSCLAYSADGAWIVAGSVSGNAFALPAAGGPLRQVQRGAAGPAVTVQATADGLVSVSRERRIQTWSPAARGLWSGHTAAATSLALLPEGKQVASGSLDGMVRIWDAATGAEARQIAVGGPLSTIAVRKDGTRLATGSPDHTVRLWNLADAKEIAQWKGDYRARGEATRLAALLGVAQQKAAAAKTALEESTKDLQAKRDAVATATTALATAQQESDAAAATAKTSVEAQQAADLTLKNATAALEVSKTNKTTAEKLVADTTAALPVATNSFQAAQGTVESLTQSVAASAKLVQTASEALATQADNVELQASKTNADQLSANVAAALESAKRALGEAEKVQTSRQQAVADAQQQLAKADADLTAADAALKTATEQKAAADKAATDTAAAAKAASDKFATAQTTLSASNTAVNLSQEQLAKATALSEVMTQQEHQSSADSAAAEQLAASRELPIHEVAFSADGNLLAVAGDDQRIEWFDATTGQPAGRLNLPTGAQGALWLADGRLVTAGGESAVRVWDIRPQWGYRGRLGGEVADPLDLEKSPFVDRVLGLAFSPDGKLLATGGGEPSRSGELKLWNVADASLVHDFGEAHSDTVFSVEFSGDGRLLASGSADKFVKVFDVASHNAVRSFEGHTHHVLGVAWRFGGSFLASSGADGVIKVWNFDSGEQARTIAGFGKEVTSIRYIGQSANTLSASGDKTVRLHNSDDGKNTLNYAGGTDFMYAVAVSPDGNTVVAGGQDSVLRVWNAADGKKPIQELKAPTP